MNDSSKWIVDRDGWRINTDHIMSYWAMDHSRIAVSFVGSKCTTPIRLSINEMDDFLHPRYP